MSGPRTFNIEVNLKGPCGLDLHIHLRCFCSNAFRSPRNLPSQHYILMKIRLLFEHTRNDFFNYSSDGFFHGCLVLQTLKMLNFEVLRGWSTYFPNEDADIVLCVARGGNRVNCCPYSNCVTSLNESWAQKVVTTCCDIRIRLFTIRSS